jgi:tRNA (guanine-N7-)-methyltransferase
MGKGKLAKFADMETYRNVFQYPFSTYEQHPFTMQGRWRDDYFHNANPIVLELGCGKGEYTVALAKEHPDANFIGVDIKGARMWTGATQAISEGLTNVAFLRTNIEIIDRFFAADEVQEIWLTFSDPQMKNPRKRRTSTYFMERYRRFLVDGGIIHLKTDSNFLFTYTRYVVEKNCLPLDVCTDDLYADTPSTVAGGFPAGSPSFPAGSPSLPAVSPSLSTVAGGFPAVSVARSIQTYYESMWLARNISIKYMQWRLPHQATLEEPDIEIELDDYRSYHRTKRSSLDKAK